MKIHILHTVAAIRKRVYRPQARRGRTDNRNDNINSRQQPIQQQTDNQLLAPSAKTNSDQRQIIKPFAVVEYDATLRRQLHAQSPGGALVDRKSTRLNSSHRL